jgi:hypothetical protein
MPRLTPATLEALEAALAKATPGEWESVSGGDDEDWRTSLRVAGAKYAITSTPPAFYGTTIAKQRVADFRLIALAHNALPALIAAASLTVPEEISEKHRDGNWWQIYSQTDGQWVYARWRDHLKAWRRMGDGDIVYNPTHAMPMPEHP